MLKVKVSIMMPEIICTVGVEYSGKYFSIAGGSKTSGCVTFTNTFFGRQVAPLSGAPSPSSCPATVLVAITTTTLSQQATTIE